MRQLGRRLNWFLCWQLIEFLRYDAPFEQHPDTHNAFELRYPWITVVKIFHTSSGVGVLQTRSARDHIFQSKNYILNPVVVAIPHCREGGHASPEGSEAACEGRDGNAAEEKTTQGLSLSQGVRGDGPLHLLTAGLSCWLTLALPLPPQTLRPTVSRPSPRPSP